MEVACLENFNLARRNNIQQRQGSYKSKRFVAAFFLLLLDTMSRSGKEDCEVFIDKVQ